jgi:hypothetical protein
MANRYLNARGVKMLDCYTPKSMEDCQKAINVYVGSPDHCKEDKCGNYFNYLIGM